MEISQVVVLVGFSHRGGDVAFRAKYALDKDDVANIYNKVVLNRSTSQSKASLIILNTCNRTEIYGIGYSADELIGMFSIDGLSDASTFVRHGYIKHGSDAIGHLHYVATGADSKIPGDFEIVGQIRNAWATAVEHGMSHPVLQRLIESSIHAGRRVRNETNFSNGTTSMAYAAVKRSQCHMQDNGSENVLVVGSGSMARSVVKGLVAKVNPTKISVVNRSEFDSFSRFGSADIRAYNLDMLPKLLTSHDIVIVATSAPHYLIDCDHVDETTNSKLIVDLSVPRNVNPCVSELETVTLINVDDLADEVNESIKDRLDEMPKVCAIVDECLATFYEWNQSRVWLPYLRAFHSTISAVHDHELDMFAKHQPNIDRVLLEAYSERLKLKLTKQLMHHLKRHHPSDMSDSSILTALLGAKEGILQ